MLRSMERAKEVLDTSAENWICWISGVTGGLMLAFSPGLWSQSVIVEVYSLNVFFLVIILLLTYRWMSSPKDYHILLCMAFLFGLGLTNHQTLMFVGLALATAIFLKDIVLFRDFLFVGVPLVLLIGLNIIAKKAGHPEYLWNQGPTSTAFWVYTILAIGIPIFAYFFLPNGKIVGPTFLLAELGFSFYLYLTFSSEGNPPINWAYPRTWEGLMHSITRGQYEKVTLSNILADPKKFMAQVGTYFTDMRTQFSIPIVIVGAIPFSAWTFQYKRKQRSIFYVACLLAFLSISLSFFSDSFKNFALCLLILATIGTVIMITQYVITELKRGRLAAKLMITLLIVVSLVLAFVDIAYLLKPLFHPETSFKSRLFYLIAVLAPLLLSGLGYWLVKGPLALKHELNEQTQKWILVTLIAFLTLSILLMIFLNPKLDIQTLFIQRVQLLQAHAVYAIWIGLGLLFTLCRTETLLGGRGLVKMLGIITVGLLPLYSLYQNYYNEERIKIIGGAEQNGHDFGWQFGNWQLRGANAIREELDPNETPLPNPDFPPEMTTNAIFYGGTDPGRFVPTYMIYSAKVRPDVYLITQNALADNTYMNVMRDLYGDQIWIPSQQDSNFAFRKYVKDVREGRVSAGAAVNIKDGKVSVQGVQGVMMINGILAKMIFDANIHKHDFYVEESYVIPWMYPYLEPHGLIMKINRKPIQITPEMTKNDHDFWEWYTKRLLGNKKFLRDIVARKTFSKLRSAVAGIYAYRRMYSEAEYAFLQAIELYPLSPEANFRLADIYMQQRKYTEARQIVEALLAGDPCNDKVKGLLNRIKNLDRLNSRRVELETKFSTGSSDVNGALELADTYLSLQMRNQFQQITLQMLNQTNLPKEVYYRISQLYAKANRMDLLETALKKYLQQDPNNVRAWIDLAAVHTTRKQTNQAIQTLTQAIKRGGAPIRDIVRKDKRFNTIRQTPAFRKLIPPTPATPNIPISIPGL